MSCRSPLLLLLLLLGVSSEMFELLRTIRFRDNLMGPVSRDFYINFPPLPLDPPLGGKRALLIVFHGRTNKCGSFRRRSGFLELAAQAGAYLVTPCAKPGYMGETAWNAGRCCVNFNKHDDVQFFDEVVKEATKLIARRNLPAFEEIWVAGFSNGGFLTEAIACQRRDVIDRFVSIAGNTVLGSGGDAAFDLCDNLWERAGAAVSLETSGGRSDPYGMEAEDQPYQPSYPHPEGLLKLEAAFRPPALRDTLASEKKLSALHIHSRGDPVVPFDGDYFIRRFPSKTKDLERWAARNGCPSSFNVPVGIAPGWELLDYCEQGPVSLSLLIEDRNWHSMEKIYGQHAMAFFTGDMRFLKSPY